MALAESFLELLTGERRRLAGLGLGGRRMIRALHDAIRAYRQAEASGDKGVMAAAREEAGRVLKENLLRLLAAVTGPLPDNQLT
jgi:hypothetical protein